VRSTRLPSWIERVCGLDPRPVPPHVFALDAKTLDFAAFGRGEGGLALLERHSEPLAEGSWTVAAPGLAPADADAFAERVAALLERTSASVHQASLVLPDEWLRAVFVEHGELPRQAAERDEVLRFKLRRLVPFRPEDLRLTLLPAVPLSGQQEPRRALVGFANEQSLARFEEAFARHGVELGQIVSAGLAMSAALLARRADGDLLLLAAGGGSFTLAGWSGGEPILYRQKAVPDEWDEATRREALVRELRLTRAFVEERLPEVRLPDPVLVVPAAEEELWREIASAGLGRDAAPLGSRALPLAGLAPGADWRELAPLVGAASAEVR
jgi:hypothetical protein